MSFFGFKKEALPEHIEIAQPRIQIKLKSRTNATRLTLRLSNKTNQITLTHPTYSRLNELQKFVQENETWIIKQIRMRPKIIYPEFGQSILYYGQPHKLTPSSDKKITVHSGQINIPNNPERLRGRLRGFYKEQARFELCKRSHHYAGMLKKSIQAISLRDTSSRWGSCSSSGKLMYSWRLIMAPIDVFDYVAAHEVAHLVEMNHSQEFWDIVADFKPDYKTQKRWLKQNGKLLSSVQF